MLLLGPTMIYAGSLSKEQLGDTKNKSIDAVFSSIIVFALFIPFIVTRDFLGKIFKTSDNMGNQNNTSDNTTDNKLTNRDWILLTHYLVFFGLFLYIGSRGRKI